MLSGRKPRRPGWWIHGCLAGARRVMGAQSFCVVKHRSEIRSGESKMRTRGLQAGIIQHGSKLPGRILSETRSLHLEKPDLAKLLECSRNIFGEILPHRVELDARRKAHGVGHRRPRQQAAERSARTCIAEKLENISPGMNLHSFFLLAQVDRSVELRIRALTALA